MIIETDALVVGWEERFTDDGKFLPVSIQLMFAPPGELTVKKLREYVVKSRDGNRASAIDLCDAMKVRLTLEVIE